MKVRYRRLSRQYRQMKKGVSLMKVIGISPGISAGAEQLHKAFSDHHRDISEVFPDGVRLLRPQPFGRIKVHRSLYTWRRLIPVMPRAWRGLNGIIAYGQLSRTHMAQAI